MGFAIKGGSSDVRSPSCGSREGVRGQDGCSSLFRFRL